MYLDHTLVGLPKIVGMFGNVCPQNRGIFV